MDTSHDFPEVQDISLALIAITYPSARLVFTRYDLDFSCNGSQSLSEACENAGVVPDYIWKEIQLLETTGAAETLHINDWSFTFLVNFIIENHHAYARRVIPEIQALLREVCDKSGEDHMELVEVMDDFNDLAGEVTGRMHREEQLLFPSIRRLHEHRLVSGDKGSVHDELQTSIASMQQEHRLTSDLLRSIRKLTNYYTPPEDACTTYKLVYKKLAGFDADMTMHIFLENNFLFEKIGT